MATGGNAIETLNTFVIDAPTKKASVFVLSKQFISCMIFFG
jgi:hypothetical protein